MKNGETRKVSPLAHSVFGAKNSHVERTYRRLVTLSVALRLGVCVTGAVVLVFFQGPAAIAGDLTVDVVDITVAWIELPDGPVFLAFDVVILAHEDLLSFATHFTMKYEPNNNTSLKFFNPSKL